MEQAYQTAVKMVTDAALQIEQGSRVDGIIKMKTAGIYCHNMLDKFKTNKNSDAFQRMTQLDQAVQQKMVEFNKEIEGDIDKFLNKQQKEKPKSQSAAFQQPEPAYKPSPSGQKPVNALKPAPVPTPTKAPAQAANQVQSAQQLPKPAPVTPGMPPAPKPQPQPQRVTPQVQTPTKAPSAPHYAKKDDKPLDHHDVVNKLNEAYAGVDDEPPAKNDKAAPAGHQKKPRVLMVKQPPKTTEQLEFCTKVYPQEEPILSKLTLAEETKRAFMNSLISPVLRPDLFVGNRRAPRSILLAGPSGTGKTFVTKAAANEAGILMLTASAGQIMNKFVGESEKQLQALFKEASKQKCILFLDEIDSILTKRSDKDSEVGRRLKTEFLQLVDGAATADVPYILVGATNRPQDIDEAARRRFETKVYVGLPGQDERVEIIVQFLKNDENSLSQSDIMKIAVHTERFSIADLRLLAQKAALNVIKGKDLQKIEEVRKVELSDYLEALKEVRPSNSPAEVQILEQWWKQ